MNKEPKKEIQDAWREGFEAGSKNTIRENSLALQLGNAILNALDGRYEFKKEDY